MHVKAYGGLLFILCVWMQTGNLVRAQAKGCGHPGDADFAEFQLVKGEDFVYGSEVEYTCKPGYQMVSRTNRRHCEHFGWDGVVPVCQVTRCPVIDVENNMETIGENPKATPGDVLGFRCTSPGEILTGPAEIRCEENGDWSERPPTCKACSSYLGIKSDLRLVSNDQMTASSAKSQSLIGQWHPHFGRLDEGGARNAWSAATNDQYQWLQVDLGCSKTITGIITQGDGGVVIGKSYVKSFKVSYSDDGGPGTVVTDANGFEKIFDGNIDSSNHQTNEFEPAVTGRYVRVLPRTWEKHIALRMELLGCEADHTVKLQTQQQQRM